MNGNFLEKERKKNNRINNKKKQLRKNQNNRMEANFLPKDKSK